MALYRFKGRNAAGQLTEGEIEGPSNNEAANALMQRGIVPISISEKNDHNDLLQLIIEKLDLQRVSIEELLMFTRQMYALSKAGIPVTRAISGIHESVKNPLLADALQDVVEQLENGRELSISFARHPKVFGNLYVSMISVGENTGRLEEVFSQLAEYIERNRKIVNNIKTALRYPSMVLIGIAVAIGIINFFVIPKFAAFFNANAIDLPLATLLLLGMSNFFTEYWYLVFGAIGGTVFGFKRWLKTDKGRYTWHRKVLGAPIIGDILKRAYLARFARSFAMAHSAGVPIVQGMGVIARSVGNEYIADRISSMREGIERGDSLTRTAAQTGMFTPVVMQMFAVGEEAGNLEDMMAFIADFYEQEVDYDVKTLSDRIEPLIYVFIGVLVLILALGIFLPMWDISQMAH